MKKDSLPFHEWFIILVLLGFLGSLAIISYLSSQNASDYLKKHPYQNLAGKCVQVEVVGEVRHPNIYEFPLGVSVKKVMAKAKPTALADRKNINIQAKDSLKQAVFDQKIYASCQIAVPKLQKLEIYVTGAVLNPGKIEMPLDGRLKDVKACILLQENADDKIFKSKRRLRNEETIHVPVLHNSG